jgi:hypothetical protein
MMFEIELRTFGYNEILHKWVTLVTLVVEFGFLANNVVCGKTVKLSMRRDDENKLQVCSRHLSKYVSELGFMLHIFQVSHFIKCTKCSIKLCCNTGFVVTSWTVLLGGRQRSGLP